MPVSSNVRNAHSCLLEAIDYLDIEIQEAGLCDAEYLGLINHARDRAQRACSTLTRERVVAGPEADLEVS